MGTAGASVSLGTDFTERGAGELVFVAGEGLAVFAGEGVSTLAGVETAVCECTESGAKLRRLK